MTQLFFALSQLTHVASSECSFWELIHPCHLVLPYTSACLLLCSVPTQGEREGVGNLNDSYCVNN